MSGIWKARLGRLRDALADSLALLVLAALGVGLGWGAWRAHQDAVRQDRRRADVAAEADRLRMENELLRGEIRALEDDPVYVESVLRQRNQAGPGEITVPK